MAGIVGCIFINKESENVLLLKRSDKEESDPYRGYWSFLTGHMEEGELPYQAMERETQEEIGFKGNNFKFIKFLTYNNSKNKTVHFYYSVVSKEFVPRLNNENMDFLWCNLDNLPKPLYPSVEKKIEDVLVLI